MQKNQYKININYIMIWKLQDFTFGSTESYKQAINIIAQIKMKKVIWVKFSSESSNLRSYQF